jgi:hypothetical protein
MNATRVPQRVVIVCIGLAYLGLFVISGHANGPDGVFVHAGDAPAEVAQTVNPNPPGQTVKLIFIHHSCGENWLADGNGGLGAALQENNYFVSDTNYGWGPDNIGDNTDIGHWWTWFRGPSSNTYLSALYTEYGDHSYNYSRLADPDPSRENQIVMFKSCFPNSNLQGSLSDPVPPIGSNPLHGQDSGSEYHTVANAKGIYIDLLNYFATRQDKLFVVITAPPVQDDTWANNARAFNTWLVQDWLDSYAYNNVAVFDFYNVLTSNGGNWYTNDLGWSTGNHHRYRNDVIEYITDQGGNVAAYPAGGSDNHPSAAGNQKATGEFVPLLNIFYNRWQASQVTATPTATGTPSTPTSTATPTSSATPTATSTPLTATPTATPTATHLPPSGQHTAVFQQGVSPDPSYAGTTDVILAGDANPNANLGAAENLETYFGDVEYRRSLVRWDLSTLPSGITVNAASLELYRYDGDASNAMQLALYRVTRDWTEGTGSDFWPDASYIPDGATWSLASPGIAWTTPGGDFDTTTDYGHGSNGIVDQITLPAGMGTGWVHLDATAAARAWLEEGVPNHGLLLRPHSGEYTYHYYYSRDYGVAELRPRLVVTYTVCFGDLDDDGQVTVRDVQMVASLWEVDDSDERFVPAYDFNSNHVIDLSDIAAIAAAWNTFCGQPLPEPTPTDTPTPTATATDTSEPGNLDVPLTVQETTGVARTGEPVTSGVPIPRDVNLTDLSTLRLLDGSSQPIPAQFTPLARWAGAPDDTGKPVRWLLLDFQADVPANGMATYRLVNSGGTTPTFPTLTVTDNADAVTVQTGVAIFNISKTDGNLAAPGLTAPLTGRLRTPAGTEYTTTGPVTVTVTLNGPMRASVRVQGAYRDDGGTALLHYTSRYWFYAGQPTVRLFHTVENDNLCPLAEYEQLDCYDIGSGGSITVTDLSLVLPTDLTSPLTYTVGGEGDAITGALTDDLLLYQDSSGTDHWNHYPTLTDWDGSPLDTRPRMQAYVNFRGYRTTLGGATMDSGDQAAGWLTVAGTGGGWTVAVRDFWQNFPKALRASPGGTLEIGLFPDEFGPAGYGFNLRAGEHKTHEVCLSLSPSPPLLASLSPLFAAAAPDWYVQSGAFPFAAARDFADWPDYESYIDYQLDTAPTYEDWMNWFPNLPAAIEGTDFYGIFDYGDVPLDYEGYLVSPMNPKYHMDYGMWLQWARGGDPRWFRLAEAADRHIADVDILHNLHTPRHWGDGIMFGHSTHDEPGFTNPHRNFQGNHPDTAFGVPGLLTTYYLTGYEKALESALELADCIEYRLHNDSHLCDFFPAGECNSQGYALGDSGGLYENGSRPAANDLFISVAAYRATVDPRYLAVADALVNWARAGSQPYIDGPIVGDGRMIKPWMLNLYLRALAEYLEMRAEFGLPDTYDAQGSFLAYADWLRTYPWLDLDPIDTGPRAAYPYEWWFDGRTENDEPSISNWLLLSADSLAYAHRLSGDADYLEQAARLFRTGSRDPWYEGDVNTYSATKETANGVLFGLVFLREWATPP